ncbi:MAG: hypothetical protein B7733_11940 [Myxococcales bacterium FL481]|nr:MAG: hypothetical protein B7733_11940 [Myxococcales bacterium FL481]
MIQTSQSGATTTLDLDVPCADTWHIYVRGLDWGSRDSFWVRVDEMATEVVFELDCTSTGGGLKWRALNWRDQGAPRCEYRHDPWLVEWGAGAHTLSLRPRESYALARVLVTNGDYDPTQRR